MVVGEPTHTCTVYESNRECTTGIQSTKSLPSRVHPEKMHRLASPRCAIPNQQPEFPPLGTARRLRSRMCPLARLVLSFPAFKAALPWRTGFRRASGHPGARNFIIRTLVRASERVPGMLTDQSPRYGSPGSGIQCVTWSPLLFSNKEGGSSRFR